MKSGKIGHYVLDDNANRVVGVTDLNFFQLASILFSFNQEHASQFVW